MNIVDIVVVVSYFAMQIARTDWFGRWIIELDPIGAMQTLFNRKGA